MRPKGLKKTLYTMCLINEGKFPITYTMVFFCPQVKVKWCLFYGWAALWLWNLDPKLPVLSVLAACSARKKMSYILRKITVATPKIIWFNAIFSISTERPKCFSSCYMSAYFTILQVLKQSLFFFKRFVMMIQQLMYVQQHEAISCGTVA